MIKGLSTLSLHMIVTYPCAIIVPTKVQSKVGKTRRYSYDRRVVNAIIAYDRYLSLCHHRSNKSTIQGR